MKRIEHNLLILEANVYVLSNADEKLSTKLTNTNRKKKGNELPTTSHYQK